MITDLYDMDVSNAIATATPRRRNANRLHFTIATNATTVFWDHAVHPQLLTYDVAVLVCVRMMHFHNIVFLTLGNFVLWSNVPAADEVSHCVFVSGVTNG